MRHRRLSAWPGVLALIAVQLLCAFAIVFGLLRLKQDFNAFKGSALRPVEFVYSQLRHAHDDWRIILAALGVWVGALLGVLAIVSRSQNTRGIAAIGLAGQTVLLILFVAVPIGIDSDQFGYVGYGNLALQGRNPYARPLLPSDATIAQKRVAAHWGNV